MVVEKLMPSKRVPGRFTVIFAGGETLSVTELLVVRYSLSLERELTAQEYGELRDEAVSENARARAMRILGSRMLSHGELTRRLKELGETQETAENTAEWLCDIGLLDDAEYARQIVAGYTARGYGSKKLRDELYRRLIPRELWDAALSALQDSGPSDVSRAAEFIRQKLCGETPDWDDRRKIGATLARRGFSWDDINEAFSVYLENIDGAYDE